jgi:ubiquinone/menaquinone biosynthesis C-methylase UbiE
MDVNDSWNSSDPYEYYMGRWSRKMAPVFLQWLGNKEGSSWIDLGCGTGALSEAIISHSNPAKLLCVDPSEVFLEKVKELLGKRAEYADGDALNIPAEDHSVEVVVSGLALNFFPDLDGALNEIKRVLKPGGTAAAYVWDYAGRMEFIRKFWDAATELDKEAVSLDEGNRFPICDKAKLRTLFSTTGFSNVDVADLDIETCFENFDDYWQPFLGAVGPAPAYIVSLNDTKRAELKNLLKKRLQPSTDGRISLTARAFAVKGRKP